MKLSMIAAVLTGYLTSVHAAEYLGKIETHNLDNCADTPVPASIANAGEAGGCFDTSAGKIWLKTIKVFADDQVDLHCYATYQDCIDNPSGSGGAFYANWGDIECRKAPENCYWLRAVVP